MAWCRAIWCPHWGSRMSTVDNFDSQPPDSFTRANTRFAMTPPPPLCLWSYGNHRLQQYVSTMLPRTATIMYRLLLERCWIILGRAWVVADCTWDVHTGYSSSRTTMAKPAWAKLTMIRKLPCVLPTYSAWIVFALALFHTDPAVCQAGTRRRGVDIMKQKILISLI